MGVKEGLVPSSLRYVLPPLPNRRVSMFSFNEKFDPYYYIRKPVLGD